MGFDTWFGFDLIQRKTLEKKLAEAGASSAAAITVAAGTDGLDAGTAQAALQDLASRVQALEDATP